MVTDLTGRRIVMGSHNVINSGGGISVGVDFNIEKSVRGLEGAQRSGVVVPDGVIWHRASRPSKRPVISVRPGRPEVVNDRSHVTDCCAAAGAPSRSCRSPGTRAPPLSRGGGYGGPVRRDKCPFIAGPVPQGGRRKTRRQ